MKGILINIFHLFIKYDLLFPKKIILFLYSVTYICSFREELMRNLIFIVVQNK